MADKAKGALRLPRDHLQAADTGMPRHAFGINHDTLQQGNTRVSSWASPPHPQAEGDEATAKASAPPRSRRADGAALPPRGAGGGTARVPRTALLDSPWLIVSGGAVGGQPTLCKQRTKQLNKNPSWERAAEVGHGFPG